MAYPTDLGALVRAERTRQGLRQEDLAFAAGVSRPFLIDLEAGKSTVRLASVLQVLAALGVELRAVLPAEGD